MPACLLHMRCTCTMVTLSHLLPSVQLACRTCSSSSNCAMHSATQELWLVCNIILSKNRLLLTAPDHPRLLLLLLLPPTSSAGQHNNQHRPCFTDCCTQCSSTHGFEACLCCCCKLCAHVICTLWCSSFCAAATQLLTSTCTTFARLFSKTLDHVLQALGVSP